MIFGVLLFSSFVANAQIEIPKQALIRKVMSPENGCNAGECNYDWKQKKITLSCDQKQIYFEMPAKDAANKAKAIDEALKQLSSVEDELSVQRLGELPSPEPLRLTLQLNPRKYAKGLYVSDVSFVDPDLVKNLDLSKKLYARQLLEVEKPGAPPVEEVPPSRFSQLVERTGLSGAFGKIQNYFKRKPPGPEPLPADLLARKKESFGKTLSDMDLNLLTGKYNTSINFNEQQTSQRMFYVSNSGLATRYDEPFYFYQEKHQGDFKTYQPSHEFYFMSKNFSSSEQLFADCCPAEGAPVSCKDYYVKPSSPAKAESKPNQASPQPKASPQGGLE